MRFTIEDAGGTAAYAPPAPLVDALGRVDFAAGPIRWALLAWETDDKVGTGTWVCFLVAETDDSYRPERRRSVRHPFMVPPASYSADVWHRWLFDRYVDVLRHEAMETFLVDGERPFAPHHGPGEDPYQLWAVGTDEARRTLQDGTVKP